jgi:hypothetical protein
VNRLQGVLAHSGKVYAAGQRAGLTAGEPIVDKLPAAGLLSVYTGA